MKEFKKDIQNLLPANLNILLNKLENNETAAFFLGRATCPYCRKFAKTLAPLVENEKLLIHFINSEDIFQLEKLKSFREQYGIKTVPALIYVHNGTLTFRCDSSMSAEEIKMFIHQN